MNLDDVPEVYKKQVCLFIRDYDDGHRLAKRYLYLVTSSFYESKRKDIKSDRKNAAKAELPVHPYLTSERARKPVGARKRVIILNFLAINPGSSIQGISDQTGIKKAVVRQHVRLLTTEGYIREEIEGAEGIKEDKVYFIEERANDYRNR